MSSWLYFRFWIGDFGFKVFCLFYYMDRAQRYRQSKIRNLKSQINDSIITA
ncbi:hypothetical protein D1AOALGA4SA_5598 [Olavius algarvensis Delta 1 endosymbiont]|nr:hypothetical protein D1AOALGA4SA_5598 [Olavius algarvensis Delta 1 endosymbiont]